MKILINICFIFFSFLFCSCKAKQELAAPTPASAINFIGHWYKAVIQNNTNIEYIITKVNTTYSINEIVSCKGADCTKVVSSNLNFKANLINGKPQLKVYKPNIYGDSMVFSLDMLVGYLYVDGFSYIKIK